MADTLDPANDEDSRFFEPVVLRPAMSRDSRPNSGRAASAVGSSTTTPGVGALGGAHLRPVAPTDKKNATPVASAPILKRNGKPKRISRWDRPPEPHDWRWAVGHLGRTLITLGLLMFGFVAYQLWGTGIQTARAQNDLDSEFNEFFEESGITPETLAPATSTSAPTAPATDSTTSPNSTVPADPAAASTVPLTPATTATPAAPVVQNYGDIDPGDALAKLIIPSIDVNWKVVAGVSVKDLAKGPGHFPDTPLPGQLGNSAIAGHRTGHGGPFYDLDDLNPGDEIQVYTQLGDAYAYIVTDSIVVSPSDYQVITTSDPNVATLTLVTCTPIGTSKQRLVVHATLDTTRGSPVGLPLIFYGSDEPIPVDPVLPADDPAASVSSVPGVVVETSVPGALLPGEESADTAVADTAATIAASDPAPTTTLSTVVVEPSQQDEFAGEDAFSQGWFDDDRAWPHVAGWAVLLAIVGYAAFRVAKRFRRLYLAFVVGFVPFVVVLYFFYENVNRLLPAAI